MRSARRLVACAAAALCGWLVAAPAGAVFTFAPLNGFQRITLRVGSPGGAVDSVLFSVTGANVSPNPLPVTGVPSGPATNPGGGVEINLFAELYQFGGQQQVTLTVDSSSSLACVSGSGCGTTLIPITTIGWQSFNRDTTYPGLDIDSGTFNGSANQVLTNFFVTGASLNMSNVLVFRYDNATLYPAGEYRARVTYTATMP